MKKIMTLCLLLVSFHSFAHSLITKKSSFDFDKTKAMVMKLIKEKGLKHFSTIDHKKGADSVGLKLEANSLIIFGNPKVGTLMMQKSPLVGIELPMKVLIYSSGANVYIAYKDIQSLKTKYSVKGMNPVFKKVSGLFKLIEKTVTK